MEGSVDNVSFPLQIAIEDTRPAFKDLENMLEKLGMEHGAGVSDAAVIASVKWLDLEYE